MPILKVCLPCTQSQLFARLMPSLRFSEKVRACPKSLGSTAFGSELEGHVGKADAARHASEWVIDIGIELIVNLTHPAESTRHDEMVADAVRVGEEQSCPEAELRVLSREGVVERIVGTIVATGGSGFLIAPEGAMNLLSLGQIVINRKTPVRLPE